MNSVAVKMKTCEERSTDFIDMLHNLNTKQTKSMQNISTEVNDTYKDIHESNSSMSSIAMSLTQLSSSTTDLEYLISSFNLDNIKSKSAKSRNLKNKLSDSTES